MILKSVEGSFFVSAGASRIGGSPTVVDLVVVAQVYCTSIFIAYPESGNIKDLCLNTMTKHC